MNRRLALLGLLVAVAGCGVGDSVQPNATMPGGVSRVISDATHSSGNPDFFFLPPMVRNPNRSPLWNRGAFNGTLTTTVQICSLAGTTEVSITMDSPCTSAYSKTYTVKARHNEDGDDDEDDDAEDGESDGEQHYDVKWTVPTSTVVFYRIKVLVGSKVLGFADVETAPNSNQLKNVNTGQFVPLKDGRSLPIKFRIEQFALCAVPGEGPCGSESINLAAGGEVTTPIPGVTGNSGVNIPPQGGGSTTTITVQSCENLNSRATDLPTYGPCLRVTADPPIVGDLSVPAIVFLCDLTPFTSTLTHAQRDRLTLHRLDEVGLTQTVTALPHAVGCPLTASNNPSVRGFLADVLHGRLKKAGGQLLAMVSPKPLYAAMFLDQGGGGSTAEFSDFQFALPSRLEIVASTNNQAAAPGATLPINPMVLVTDIGGAPVAGARVRFGGTASSCLASAIVSGVNTNASGNASTTWTLSPVAGPNSLVACGRGLAGSDNNGPRTGDDPFQPVQAPFDVSPPPVASAVTVLSGSVQFAATGISAPVDYFGFGSGGYSYLGFSGAGTAQGIGTLVVPPAGWQTPAFTPTGWTSSASAPFGTGCGLTAASPFPDGNFDVLARKLFFTSAAGTVKVTLHLDNDAQVWLDGVNVTSTGVGNNFLQANDPGAADDWWIHDNCADIDDTIFTVPGVSAGLHTLAIWAHNRGGPGLLDVKVSLVP